MRCAHGSTGTSLAVSTRTEPTSRGSDGLSNHRAKNRVDQRPCVAPGRDRWRGCRRAEHLRGARRHATGGARARRRRLHPPRQSAPARRRADRRADPRDPCPRRAARRGAEGTAAAVHGRVRGRRDRPAAARSGNGRPDARELLHVGRRRAAREAAARHPVRRHVPCARARQAAAPGRGRRLPRRARRDRGHARATGRPADCRVPAGRGRSAHAVSRGREAARHRPVRLRCGRIPAGAARRGARTARLAERRVRGAATRPPRAAQGHRHRDRRARAARHTPVAPVARALAGRKENA